MQTRTFDRCHSGTTWRTSTAETVNWTSAAYLLGPVLISQKIANKVLDFTLCRNIFPVFQHFQTNIAVIIPIASENMRACNSGTKSLIFFRPKNCEIAGGDNLLDKLTWWPASTIFGYHMSCDRCTNHWKQNLGFLLGSFAPCYKILQHVGGLFAGSQFVY